jgi:8-oxo-dGTP diphosphatase
VEAVLKYLGGKKLSVAKSTNLQGAKIAVICEEEVLVYLRDNVDHIPNPNQWDLPGGIREDGETAVACALRELEEEFGVQLPEDTVIHEAIYTAEAGLGSGLITRT